MSFDHDYPNRKDQRTPYRTSARFDTSCRPHGGCGWCEGNRMHADTKRRLSADEQMDEAFDAIHARTVDVIGGEWAAWLEVEA